jgi:TolB-like protein/tetratricopeptide (TPR) repeat protein
MLAGEPPFTGPTAQTILARHAVDPVPCLRTVRPTVSAGLEAVVSRALAKVPADRYASVEEFGKALAQVLNSPAESLSQPVPSAPDPTTRRRRRLIAAAALGGLVVAGAGMRTWLPGSRSASPAATQPIRSIAVAPFTNLTGDSGQIYLTQGVTDQLVTTLAQLGDLRVVALTRKQAAASTKELSDKLAIEALLTGSLQRVGTSLRITIQLSSTTGDQALWARSFDGEVPSILALQDEVARSVVDRVQVVLTPGERARISAGRRVVNPAAYEAYVRGIYFLGKVTGPDFRRAIGYFQQAIDLDPTYAGAYAGLAESYNELGYYTLGAPTETFPKGRAAALKALELDPDFADAHGSLGKVELLYTWDFTAADSEYRRAVQLSPKSGRNHMGISFFLAAMGHRTESISDARKSVELDPLSLLTSAAAARPYYNARQYSAAVAQSQATLEMDSTFSRARFWLGLSYEQLDRKPDAIRELQRTVAYGGRIPVYLGALGHAYAVAGRPAEALKLVAELERRADSSYVSPYDIAIVYVGLGRTDEAFAWLEKAFQGRAYGLVFLNVDPRLDTIRSDPRFVGLARRVGLPPGGSAPPKT